MKIGIDLKPFYSGSKYRGIGMYARNFVAKILETAPEHDYHYLSLYGPYADDPQKADNVTIHEYYTGPMIKKSGETQLFSNEETQEVLKAQVAHFLNVSRAEAMIFTSPTEYGNLYQKEWFEGIFTVGILYDLIPMIFPQQCLFDPGTKKNYDAAIDFLKSLDLLLAISQSAKDDAVKLLGISADKIHVIYAGISDNFAPATDEIQENAKKNHQIGNDFLIFAGGIDFKKNIPAIIESFSILPKTLQKKYQLVIVGKAEQSVLEQFLNIAEKFHVRDKVVCTGFVSDDDLVGLMTAADALIFPSLYEGFGLPVLEAMLCGTLVLTSNTSSLKELATGHAEIVTPKSVRSIAKGIANLLALSDDEKEARVLKATQFAKTFTWESVAQKSINRIQNDFQNFDSLPAPNYSFEVSDALLKNIATTYAKESIVLKAKESKLLAQQLAKIEAKDFSLEAPMKNQRILFDITVAREWFLADYSTGIGRVCKELYHALEGFSDIVSIAMIEDAGIMQMYTVNMHTFSLSKAPIQPEKEDVYLLADFQIKGIQVSKKHDTVSYMKAHDVPIYAVVYDILPILMPEYFEATTANQFPSYLADLLVNYNGILSDSRSVSDSIIAYLKDRDDLRIKKDILLGYFHLGSNSFQTKSHELVSAELAAFFSNLDDIFLMVGTIEPRKGHDTVLDAFTALWNEGFEDKLCIIGNLGWNMEPFLKKMKEHPQYGKKLAFYQSATDASIQYAYEHSTALIQASAGEGYGLPLIEASQYEIPIICSDIPVFHEVTQEHALFFEPMNHQSLIHTIKVFQDALKTGSTPDSSKIKQVNWSDAARKVSQMLLEHKNWYAKQTDIKNTVYFDSKEGESTD